MQAIHSKYIPATNTLGSRIKATCERGSITIDYPHELSGDAVHREAALQLLERFVSEDWTERAIPPVTEPVETGICHRMSSRRDLRPRPALIP
jgi:hypothetical protein